MINIFHKIRQNLIAENKFSKYLIYAIGEVVLVVIGILIALQINNWNEGRKDVQREIKMLTDLQNDIENNIKNINEGIIVLEEGVNHGENVLLAFEKKAKYDSTMNRDFGFYRYFWDPDFRYASFENLKKEGVNLISNDSLRNKIIELYEIDMDILDESDLQRRNNYMNSVGYPITNKYLYIDNKTDFSLPFDYKNMMSDNEFYSFTSYYVSTLYLDLDKSNKFIGKARIINKYITDEIKRLQ